MQNDAGYGVIEWSMLPKAGGKPFHLMKSFKSAAEAWGFVAWLLNKGAKSDVWFCTSLQAQTQLKTGRDGKRREVGLRNVANTLGCKAIFLDVDVKPEGYATKEDALKAIAAVCKYWKLPMPSALVHSGNGIHCYWISNRVMPLDEWRWYAERLRAAALAAGLKFDGQCTVDPVRILRVPETYNHKSDPPKGIKLLHLDPADVDFVGTLKPLLDPVTVAAPTISQRAVAAIAPLTALPASFAGGPAPEFAGKTFEIGGEGIKLEAAPLDWKPILSKDGCPWLHEALVTGGANHDNPQWHLMGLCTVFAGDKGRKLAHALGNKHKDYDPATTDALFDRKCADKKRMDLGWPACKSIEQAGSTACALCPHRDKIKSPLDLGKRKSPPERSGLERIVTQVRQTALNPVAALRTLRDQGADIGEGTMNDLVVGPHMWEGLIQRSPGMNGWYLPPYPGGLIAGRGLLRRAGYKRGLGRPGEWCEINPADNFKRFLPGNVLHVRGIGSDLWFIDRVTRDTITGVEGAYQELVHTVASLLILTRGCEAAMYLADLCYPKPPSRLMPPIQWSKPWEYPYQAPNCNLL
jgi:hypothetical protein